MCTRVETGEICAIHNAPGPEERFTSIAPVQAAGDPTIECGRVWACTSSGRVLVLNTSNTGSYQESLQTTSYGAILCMLPSGIGEIWTLRDDGLVEVWRDRSVEAAALEQPLVPLRKFSIATELQAARRVANQRTMILLYQRELWFAGSRSIWVYDTHTSADTAMSASSNGPLSTRLDQPLMVAHLSLTAHDAPITCIASNVPYLDEARIDSRGYVFSGTDAGHIIAWKASDYERWRTIDMSNGEPEVRITSLVCVSDRWLWVGFASGKIAILDIGPDSHPTAAQCPLTLGLQDGVGGAAQRRDTMWVVAKEWLAAESAVTGLLVDWSPLLADRQRVQVASVHANGSVYYWDGSLTVDCQYNELRRRTPDFAHMRDITVQINSWNIDSIKPEVLEKTREDQHFLRGWLGALGGQQMPDIIVVGLQEVVDLESKKMTAKSLWKNTTSKSKPKGKAGSKPAADISKRYGLWRSALEKALSRGMTFSTAYRAVECQNMVGLFICVFARDDIYRSVREVDVSHVKTGMGGLHGNKGGIGIRFVFEDTSFCFVNAHLAAGESVRNNMARIEHCAAIVKSLSFKRPMPEYQSLAANELVGQHLPGQNNSRQTVSPTADLANLTLDAYVDGGDGQRFLDHAVCFFSGDLNFRLGLGRQQVERYLDINDLDTLLQFDQLLPMITLGAQPRSLSSQPSSSNLRSESSTPIVAPNRVSAAATPYEDSVSTLHYQARSSQSSSAYSSGDEDDGEGLTSIGTAGFALRTFREMPILFRPTYKYDPGTDTYDTSEKRRVPAWCDRVLFRGGSGQLQVRHQHGNIDSQQQVWHERFGDYDLQGQTSPLIYQRLETRQSDHRPIVAAFRVKVKTVDREARSVASVDVRRRADTKTLPEMAYFAKTLWLSRYTASMSRASELLAATGGDLPNKSPESSSEFNSIQLRDILRDELIAILDTVQIRGSKALVLDRDLSGALSIIVDFGVLKDHGVEKIFLLEEGPLDTGPTKGVLYLSLPHIRKMKIIAEQVRASSLSGGVSKEYSLQLVPRRTLLCERVLEEEGVLGDITIGEYRMDFIPLESDLLSLELPSTFKELYLDGDFSCIQHVARAVMRLQGLYGFFPRIVGKGDFAQVLADSLARMRLELVSGGTGGPSSSALAMSTVFDSVVVIDRAVDMVTPLLTQLTYEGLISEVYGISNGSVTLGGAAASTPSAAGAATAASAPGASGSGTGSGSDLQNSGKRRRIMLNDSDAIYREVRSMNFAGVGALLSKISRQLQDNYESRHRAKTVQEIRSFVGKLGGLQAEHQSLKSHVSLAESIMRRTQSDDFNSILDIEQSLVGGSDLTKEQLAFIEKMLALADPNASVPGVGGELKEQPPASMPNSIHKVLRVLCLYSLWRGPNFKQKTYDSWYEDIVAAFGHHQTITLDNLDRVGLLSRPSSTTQIESSGPSELRGSGLLNSVAPSTKPRSPVHANSIGFLRKALNLIVSDVRESNPDDISYVYSGYAPISIRLLQCLVRDPAVYPANPSSRYAALLRPLGDNSRARPALADGQSTGGVKGGWAGWEDVLNELPGETIDVLQSPSDGDSDVAAADAMVRRRGEKAPATLVVFLGGCTFTEIAALRLLSQQHGHRYIAATTQIINGNSFLDSLVQKPTAV
ncbi:Vacuolar protein-sorting-associated protein 33 [Coemansia sp. RSA 2675]|nr:Vacuolar protein-sorting-associated protein 33 [Coemansia sp. RSA 2675]